jgi:hypothetical protein
MKTYEVHPRSAELGGGWSLKLYEEGHEMGGGVFPPMPNQDTPEYDEAYQDAIDEGERWIE